MTPLASWALVAMIAALPFVVATAWRLYRDERDAPDLATRVLADVVAIRRDAELDNPTDCVGCGDPAVVTHPHRACAACATFSLLWTLPTTAGRRREAAPPRAGIDPHGRGAAPAAAAVRHRPGGAA